MDEKREKRELCGNGMKNLDTNPNVALFPFFLFTFCSLPQHTHTHMRLSTQTTERAVYIKGDDFAVLMQERKWRRDANQMATVGSQDRTTA